MTSPRRPRRRDSSALVVALLLALGLAGIALEVYAWVTIGRTGLAHAPGWALWVAFAGR